MSPPASAPAAEAKTEDYRQMPTNTRLDHLPGDYGLPYFGRTFRSLYHLPEFLQEQYQQYGPISRTRIGGENTVLALGPEVSQTILLDRERCYSSEMGYQRNMAPYFGGALMLMDFNEHRMHRRIMQTAFKTTVLQSYTGIMNPMLEESIRSWRKQENFYFYPAIKRSLLRVAARIFIGLENPGPDLERMNRAFLDTVDALRAIFRVDLPGFRMHKGLKGRRYLYSYFEKMLPDKRVREGQDMFSYFAKERTEEGALYSDDAVIKHIIFLMMAAHDTTTSALSSCCAELVLNPDWQERIREDSAALGRDMLEYEDLDKLVPLDRFMHEVLRAHGPVPLSVRRTVRDKELEGHRIPAHSIVAVAPTFSHYMEEWWDEPKRFDPERFSPERAEHKRHSFNFMPFGGGAHKCIGMHFAMMQIKCFIHQFLQHYRVRLPDGYKLPIRYQEVPFPHPADKLPVVLEPLQ